MKNSLGIFYSLTPPMALFLTSSCCALSQGFVNLDFESPLLPLVPTNFLVPIADAMPGWSGYIGGVPQDQVVYDTVSLGAAAISFHDTNSSIPILQGSYTVLLQGSFPGGAVVPAIGQTGTVPTTARSLTYYGQGPFTVTFAGQQIPVTAIGSGPNYTFFGGDISAYAGQTGELRFQGGGLLDNIQFSTSQIPEPSMFGFLGLGAVFLVWRFVRQR